MRGYTYHEIVYLLIGLVCGVSHIAPLCSALAATLEKRLVSYGQEQWYSMVNNNHGGSVVLQDLVLTYNHSCPLHKCDKPQKSLQHCCGKLKKIFR